MQETERLISQGYRRFYTGGALGFDTVAAIVILKLKNRYPDIKLILALPCSSQTKGWKKRDIENYEKGTINYLVSEKLKSYAEKSKHYN